MAATDPLGPGGVLAWHDLRRENERLVAENRELRRRLAEYEQVDDGASAGEQTPEGGAP